VIKKRDFLNRVTRKGAESPLDEEGIGFKRGSQLFEEIYSGSVQKVCKNWKYGKEIIHGKCEKDY